MEPCKHGHVDGVMHIPCYQCRCESLESQLSNLKTGVAHLVLGIDSPTKPKTYSVSEETMTRIWNVLTYYSYPSTYDPPRTGGILEGCPRGPSHLNDLYLDAEQTLKALTQELHGTPLLTPPSLHLLPNSKGTLHCVGLNKSINVEFDSAGDLTYTWIV